MMVDVTAALYLTMLGWLVLRPWRDGLGLEALAGLAFPAGLAVWGLSAGVAFALGVLNHFLAVASVVALGAMSGSLRSLAPTLREGMWLAAVLAAAAIVAAITGFLEPTVIGSGQDPRWYVAIGQQIAQFGGLDLSLRAQFATRPFLLPFLTSVAAGAGQNYFTFVEPLCGVSAVALVVVFGRRLTGPGSLLPVLAAAALASTAPFLWSAVYLNPHAAFAALLLAATGCVLVAGRDGDGRWLLPFTICASVLALTRVESGLVICGLLVVVLALPGIALRQRVAAVAVVASVHALWQVFVLVSTFGHGGLTVYQIALFGVAPGLVAATGIALMILAIRLPALAETLAARLPMAFVLANLAALATHEMLWPYSVLRALTIAIVFIVDPDSGFAPVAVLGLGSAVIGLCGFASPSVRRLGVVIFGFLATVLVIAAHTPYQAPTIVDSVNRMLLHVIPLVALCLAAGFQSRRQPTPHRRAVAWVVVSGVVVVALSAWLFTERYYLRFLPVPPALFSRLDAGPVPALTLAPPTEPRLPVFDLSTEPGLVAAVAFVRGWSPTSGPQIPWAGGGDTGQWLDHLRRSPEYCTDAAQFLMLLAARQGLMVREVHLFMSDHYAAGDAHTIMEFWNTRTARWVAVDGQTGTLYRDPGDGHLLGMVDILRIGPRRVVYDRIVPTVPGWLDGGKLMMDGTRTTVLNFITPPWLGRSGPTPVVGYALVTDGSSHDPRIFTTKWLFLALVAALAVLGRNLMAIMFRRTDRNVEAR